MAANGKMNTSAPKYICKKERENCLLFGKDMEFEIRSRLSSYGFKSLMPYENLGELWKPTELLTIFLTKLNRPKVKLASDNSYN